MRRLLVAATVLSVAALIVGLVITDPDYDEVMHTHAIWMIEKGLVPFKDFLETHPPLAWYAYLPIVWLLPERPESLFVLRLFSALGLGMWSYAMFRTFEKTRPDIGRSWILLALLSGLISFRTLQYAVEFRPDSLANAVLFGAIFVYVCFDAWPERVRGFVLGFGCTLAIVALPKLYVLPPLFVASELVRRIARRTPLLPLIAPVGAGIAGGALVSLLALWLAGIDLDLAFNAIVRFHMQFYSTIGFPKGVLGFFLEQVPAAIVTFSGIAAAVFWYVRKREAPTSFELAVFGTALWQFLTVPVPYKQYVAPCFIILSIFFPFVGRVVPRMEAAIAILLALGFSLSIATQLERTTFPKRLIQHRAILEMTAADDPILVPPPIHPIYRKDSIYAWMNAWDPLGKNSLDRVFQDMHHPLLSPELEAPAQIAELEAHPPAILVVTGAPFQNPTTVQAINAYLAGHGGSYVRHDGARYAYYLRNDREVRADIGALVGSSAGN